jgi:hypothetical protein
VHARRSTNLDSTIEADIDEGSYAFGDCLPCLQRLSKSSTTTGLWTPTALFRAQENSQFREPFLPSHPAAHLGSGEWSLESTRPYSCAREADQREEDLGKAARAFFDACEDT